MDYERIPIEPPFTGVLTKTGERILIIAYLPKHPPAFIYVIPPSKKEVEAEEGIEINEEAPSKKEATAARQELSPAIKKKIRLRLQQEKRKTEKELEEANNNLKQSFRESTQRISSNHPAEFITDSSPALMKQKVENCKKRLKKIEQAFLRLDVFGNYGICSCGCGRQIPISRLTKIPFTSLRADCKERIEEENNNNPLQKKRRPKHRR